MFFALSHVRRLSLSCFSHICSFYFDIFSIFLAFPYTLIYSTAFFCSIYFSLLSYDPTSPIPLFHVLVSVYLRVFLVKLSFLNAKNQLRISDVVVSFLFLVSSGPGYFRHLQQQEPVHFSIELPNQSGNYLKKIIYFQEINPHFY